MTNIVAVQIAKGVECRFSEATAKTTIVATSRHSIGVAPDDDGAIRRRVRTAMLNNGEARKFTLKLTRTKDEDDPRDDHSLIRTWYYKVLFHD